MGEGKPAIIAGDPSGAPVVSERTSVLPFPLWLVAVDLVGAMLVLAGLLLRTGVVEAAGLPKGVDLLLLALGGLAIVGSAIQILRVVRTTHAAKSSR